MIKEMFLDYLFQFVLFDLLAKSLDNLNALSDNLVIETRFDIVEISEYLGKSRYILRRKIFNCVEILFVTQALECQDTVLEQPPFFFLGVQRKLIDFSKKRSCTFLIRRPQTLEPLFYCGQLECLLRPFFVTEFGPGS